MAEEKKKFKVALANAYGFCFGVRRAVQIVEQARQERFGKLTTLGPIIHNPQVVNKHQQMGIELAANLEDISDGTVVMSAHGVPPSTIQRAKELGLDIIDVTCPFVVKVHRAAKIMAQEGYTIVIVGDKGHSEVKGVLGTVESVGGKVFVVSTPEEVADLPIGRKVGVVCQTTQKASNFAAVLGEIALRSYETRSYNTICGATDELQSAALALSNESDVILVIGGKNSANTRRLRDICESHGVPTYHIETRDEIQPEWLEGKSVVGVTAGASTPDSVINDVLDWLSCGEVRVPENKKPYDIPRDTK
ncbi:MAG: 4-hydroxy-3-methylbut-2-enyl diphosphate reductase [bacterium]|jgi:(E)-4-hydroxy-3-methyl-but-2-enyl pyrophosphate reductase